jgi:hypothetical protein
MLTKQIYYYLNDSLIDLTGLKDDSTGSFVTNATVTAVVKKAGVNVTGQSWPLTLTYITASDGNYRGILEAALNVSVGDRLTLEVTVDAGSGREAFFSIPLTVRQRGQTF